MALMRLAEFLLARIAEDEQSVRYALDADSGFVDDSELVKCEALRRIVDLCEPTLTHGTIAADDLAAEILQLLALPYSDHPAYQDGWRP